MILCAWRWDEPRYIGACCSRCCGCSVGRGAVRVATSLRRLTAIDWCVAGDAELRFGFAIVLSGSELLLHLYPSFVNLGLLLAFGATLVRGPSMIEKFARLGNPELGPHAVRYTRRVTQMWCVFFALNGAFSAYTALCWSRAAWSLYNGANRVWVDRRAAGRRVRVALPGRAAASRALGGGMIALHDLLLGTPMAPPSVCRDGASTCSTAPRFAHAYSAHGRTLEGKRPSASLCIVY